MTELEAPFQFSPYTQQDYEIMNKRFCDAMVAAGYQQRSVEVVDVGYSPRHITGRVVISGNSSLSDC